MTDELLEYRSTVPGEEPECEVLLDDTWHPGFVRGWYRYADGWKASVQYSTQPGSNYLRTFPADQLRVAKQPT